VRGIFQGVEHHLWSSDSCPAYMRMCAWHSSKPIPRFTAVRAEGGGFEPEVNICLGRACGVKDSLDHGVWRRQYLCRRTKV